MDIQVTTITMDAEPKPKKQKIEKAIIVAEHGDQLPSGSGIDIGPNKGVVGGGESTDQDCIFEKFFKDEKTYKKFMSIFQYVNEDFANAFVPIVISNCDAGQNPSRYGKPFSECECFATTVDEKEGNDFFPFGAFFAKSSEIVYCFDQKKIPSDPIMKKAARKLLRFLMEDKEWHNELFKLGETEYVASETQVMVTLAEHYFKRLTIVKGYCMDKHADKAHLCNCTKCDGTISSNLNFDDTSIGHPEVWHGNLDLLFDSYDIALKVAPEVEDESAGGRTNDEFKKLEDLDSFKSRSQILAQTIVFSFLKKQKHPGAEHFLVPFFIANNTSFKVFCYDAHHDVLLESRIFKLINKNKHINFDAAIAAWLILNHQLFGTGLFKEVLENAPKSRFRELAGDSLKIYENKLSLRKVPDVSSKMKIQTFRDWFSKEAPSENRFVWPESVPPTFPNTSKNFTK